MVFLKHHSRSRAAGASASSGRDSASERSLPLGEEVGRPLAGGGSQGARLSAGREGLQRSRRLGVPAPRGPARGGVCRRF